MTESYILDFEPGGKFIASGFCPNLAQFPPACVHDSAETMAV
jgi:hypothetical protein